MGKAVSAYFTFCDEHRAQTKADILDETGFDKISVAQVAKALGEKWKKLSDEEKKQYKEKADQKNKEAEALAGKENEEPSQQV